MHNTNNAGYACVHLHVCVYSIYTLIFLIYTRMHVYLYIYTLRYTQYTNIDKHKL